MLIAKEMGMIGDQYVYIFPDLIPDENDTEPWIQRDYHKGFPDGRDEEAKSAFQKALIVCQMIVARHAMSLASVV